MGIFVFMCVSVIDYFENVVEDIEGKTIVNDSGRQGLFLDIGDDGKMGVLALEGEDELALIGTQVIGSRA